MLNWLKFGPHTRNLFMEQCEFAANILWEFMSQQDALGTPKTIFVFGSTDLIVAAFAASLYFHLKPTAIVCSGGIAHQGDLLSTNWAVSEARMMADVLKAFDVPENIIHLDEKATNTGENFNFSVTLAGQKELNLSNVLVVHKPYMTLRTRLTGRAQCSELEFRIAGPRFSFDHYAKMFMPRDRLLNIMVGDFQRIVEYQKNGFSAPCVIPADVNDAFQTLVEAGYVKHLLDR